MLRPFKRFCSLWKHQIKALLSLNKGQIDSSPNCCLITITDGYVDGSTTNFAHSTGLRDNASCTTSSKRGHGLNTSITLLKVEVRTGARAGHWKDNQCVLSPGKKSQPERVHFPESLSSNLDNILSSLYFPEMILACTVAALTAETEPPQLSQSGWGPEPKGKNSARINCRLGLSLMLEMKYFRQYWVIFVLTNFLKTDLGCGDRSTLNGEGRPYFAARSWSSQNQEEEIW